MMCTYAEFSSAYSTACVKPVLIPEMIAVLEAAAAQIAASVGAVAVINATDLNSVEMRKVAALYAAAELLSRIREAAPSWPRNAQRVINPLYDPDAKREKSSV